MNTPFQRGWNRISDFYKGMRTRDHDRALGALGYRVVRVPAPPSAPSEAQRYLHGDVLATIDEVRAGLAESSLSREKRSWLARQLEEVRELLDTPTFPSGGTFRFAAELVELAHGGLDGADTDWSIRRQLPPLVHRLRQLAGESREPE
jgi:hypothetical protein